MVFNALANALQVPDEEGGHRFGWYEFRRLLEQSLVRSA
jgi:hypothetical protein